ncbi:caspase family protein [Bacteroidota bacterium]
MCLQTKNINQDEVMVKLREYAQRTYKPQDQLMVFFAGHGHYDDVYGEGYVVARNSLANDEGKNTYISHNRIRNNINNIQCEHIFLVMDVYFGGMFDPVLASARNVYEDTRDREYLAKKLSMKTRKYLTSGSKEYVSDGIIGQHSPFAKRFIEAMKSNGGEDRILILDEIKLHMERLQTTPRVGEFGDDEKGSDFVFVAK